ncbi:MAG: hypothetical protein H0X26_08300 [Alphaproteobacteria bacterium]|nr:hypothetical protein [Alphaproteobacteria bacterium]
MFYLIEPQEHHLYESSITPFVEELQSITVFKGEQDLQQATFLLLKKEIKDVCGGLLLLKQKTSTLNPEVEGYLRSFCPQIKEVWTGSISFQMSEEIAGRDFDKICKILYRSLYEELIVFGIRENITFLCLTMPLIEQLSINLLGLWPYMFEVRPSAASSGALCHGILALPGPLQGANSFWKYDNPLQDPNFVSSETAFHIFWAQNCDEINTV